MAVGARFQETCPQEGRKHSEEWWLEHWVATCSPRGQGPQWAGAGHLEKLALTLVSDSRDEYLQTSLV